LTSGITLKLEGHFFVAGLKETKSNIRSNRLRSQYTGVTSHIKITHRNVTQLHIFHIFTNSSTILWHTFRFTTRPRWQHTHLEPRYSLT